METLNQSPAEDDESFPPILWFEKLEIHPVFLRFSNLVLTKNLSPSILGDLFRASPERDTIALCILFFIVSTSRDSFRADRR